MTCGRKQKKTVERNQENPSKHMSFYRMALYKPYNFKQRKQKIREQSNTTAYFHMF